MKRIITLIALVFAIAVPSANATPLSVSFADNQITVLAKKLLPNTSYAISCVVTTEDNKTYDVGGSASVSNNRGKVTLILLTALSSADCWIRSGSDFDSPPVRFLNGRLAVFTVS